MKTSSFIAKNQRHMIENIMWNFKEHYKPNLVYNSCNLDECNQKTFVGVFKTNWKQWISNIHSRLYWHIWQWQHSRENVNMKADDWQFEEEKDSWKYQVKAQEPMCTFYLVCCCSFL